MSMTDERLFPRQTTPPDAGAEKPRVLVVEDHADTAKMLAIVLERWGYRVMSAGSLDGALALIAQHEFGLLVCDIGLPDGSGVDLMRRIEGRIPGVILSGRDDDEVRAGLQAGFGAHLLKPVEFTELQRTIDRVLAARADKPSG